MGVLLDKNQREAVRRLRSGSILKGGVGSGKSLTALAYYLERECGCDTEHPEDPWYMKMRSKRDLYIITTAKKRDELDWVRECSQYALSPDMDGCYFKVKVVIDSWNNIQKYVNVCGAFFIFDEQRAIGSGTWAKCFIQISKKNRWIMLSATPGDVWLDYIPVFVANGFYKNRTQFLREHCVFSHYTQYPKLERYINCEKLIRLKEMVIVDMNYIRSAKRHSEYVLVGYDKPLYYQTQRERWNYEKDEPFQNASALVQAMRKTVNASHERVDAVTEIIFRTPKIIIFYNYNYELDILRDICKRLELYCAEWNGQKHMPVPTYDKWAYLVQYTAGAEGWECITANTILFYSLNYSYKIMEQASGRIDRRNTPFSDLYYYYIYSNSSVDLRILDSLKNKKKFNENDFVSTL